MSGGEVSHVDVRNAYDRRINRITDPATDGMDDFFCYNCTAKQVGRQAAKGINNPNLMFEQMTCGDDFGITYAVSGVDKLGDAVSGWHNVLVTKVSRTTWIKPDGTLIMRKPKFWVMDPAGNGSIRRIYSNQLERVVRVY